MIVEEKTIGIDLGSTNSYSAVLEDGKPEIVPTAEGKKATPSTVGFTKQGELVVGAPARRQKLTNPEGTIISIREKLGKDCKVRVSSGGREKDYAPEWIASRILAKIKEDAEGHVGQKVGQAVITVPAHFAHGQRQAIKEAGKLAGLKEVRIIDEPVAASLAYGLNGPSEQEILVYDLGKSTFNASVLEPEQGELEVVSTHRAPDLGGNRFDRKIIDWLVEGFSRRGGSNLLEDRTTALRLRDAAEEVKKELSSSMETTINLPYITAERSGPKHLEEKLTRAKFEQLIQGLLQETIRVTKLALSGAEIRKGEVNEVVLVGGSTRIPRVRELLAELVSGRLNREINPSEVVALGAAIKGRILGYG